MAGAKNRAPDTGEQRAEDAMRSRRIYAAATALKPWIGPSIEAATVALKMAVAALEAADASVGSDPASVIAHLLAEHPDATIAALETLLTSDEAERAAGDYFAVAKAPTIEGILSAACRSLRPNTPNEER